MSKPMLVTNKMTEVVSPDLLAVGQMLLRALPENPAREGLLRTPHRFAKAFQYLCSGYDKTAEDAVGEGVFAAEGKGLVSVNDVEFYSLCEHHVLPFWGQVSVAYLPRQHILGLSKIPRLVERHARRLQVQERLTESIVQDLRKLIDPLAVVVQVRGQHLCMMMRGVEKQGSFTLTESTYRAPEVTDHQFERLLKATEKA